MNRNTALAVGTSAIVAVAAIAYLYAKTPDPQANAHTQTSITIDQCESSSSPSSSFSSTSRSNRTRTRNHKSLKNNPDSLSAPSSSSFSSSSSAPSSIKSLSSAASTYFLSNNYVAAIDCYNQAIALAPRHPGLHCNRAQVFLCTNQFAAALRDAQACIQLAEERGIKKEKMGKAHMIAARAYINLKQFEEAVEALSVVIASRDAQFIPQATTLIKQCKERIRLQEERRKSREGGGLRNGLIIPNASTEAGRKLVRSPISSSIPSSSSNSSNPSSSNNPSYESQDQSKAALLKEVLDLMQPSNDSILTTINDNSNSNSHRHPSSQQYNSHLNTHSHSDSISMNGIQTSTAHHDKPSLRSPATVSSTSYDQLTPREVEIISPRRPHSTASIAFENSMKLLSKGTVKPEKSEAEAEAKAETKEKEKASMYVDSRLGMSENGQAKGEANNLANGMNGVNHHANGVKGHSNSNGNGNENSNGSTSASSSASACDSADLDPDSVPSAVSEPVLTQ